MYSIKPHTDHQDVHVLSLIPTTRMYSIKPHTDHQDVQYKALYRPSGCTE